VTNTSSYHPAQDATDATLTHGRRKFVELSKMFSDQVKHILHELKKVYRTDAAAKRFKLSPQLRLQLHQRRSEPVMTALHDWLTLQLEEKKVEPNSSLGNAVQYMLKHWDKLTLFLRREGAPLDNNIAERAMKMAIRHRKNSLYYRSKLGAEVGDIYMSLIYTCQFAAVDPVEYLTATLKNASKVQEDPARWLPWNYRDQLALAD
jgi:transposase